MTEDNQPSFRLPSVSRKKIPAAFDVVRFPLKRRQRREPSASPACGRLVYRRPCERRARDRAARRCARRACRRSYSGYPDGNDFNRLRFDSGLKACLRSPARHQPRPLLATDHLALGECQSLREIIRLNYRLVDIWCRVIRSRVVLDIDNTVDVVARHKSKSSAKGGR